MKSKDWSQEIEFDLLYQQEYAYISEKERDKIKSEDFAGPNRSYPINSQKHLDSAVKLIGKAPKSKQASIKARIKEIAKRKGLTLPKDWS